MTKILVIILAFAGLALAQLPPFGWMPGGGGGGSGDLLASNNLSDVGNTTTARTNLNAIGGASALTTNNSIVVVHPTLVGVLAEPAIPVSVTATGLGVGTASPSGRVEAFQADSDTDLIIVTSSRTTGAARESGILFRGSPAADVTLYPTGRIYAKWDGGSYGTERLTFASMVAGSPVDTLSLKNGNVGINMTTPPNKLSVLGVVSGYGGYTDASNFFGWTLTSTDGATTLAAGTGGTGADAQNIVLTPAGAGQVNVMGPLSVAGAVNFNNYSLSNVNGIVLYDTSIIRWNTTSSFPAIKRNGTGIDFRLADDSAYAPIAASTYSVGATAGVDLTCAAGVATLTVSKGLIVGGSCL